MGLRLPKLFPTFLFWACVVATTHAQSLDVKINVVSLEPPRVHVEGVRSVGTKAWSFQNVYAGAIGLGERIENLALADASGQEIPVRRLAPGEFEAAREAVRFSYDLRLDPSTRPADAAHVSWLTGERGLLLLGDVLPVTPQGARVRFSLPPAWSVSTSETLVANQQYEIADAAQAVFFVGRDLRVQSARRGAMEYTFATNSTWAFDDASAASTVSDILKDYEKILGGVPSRRAHILITPFPRPAPAQSWNAETRGGTVILISGQLPSKTFALTRLDAVLSHELLHLWVPNGLALDGEYDWFYEGFTLYMAMRSGLRRGQLTFQDYLDAIGRAYDAYRTNRGAQEFSLIEASRRRWTLSPTLIYDKGLLVAFLYDLKLLQRTRGKSSLEDVYRALFRRHNSKATRADGNRAALDALNGMGGMQDFTLRHVEKPSELDLATEISAFGLRLEPVGMRTRITVSDPLSGAHGDLLRKLGYNEKAGPTVRRLHEKLSKPPR